MFQLIPFTQYIFYEQMNLQGLKKKLDEFNSKVGGNLGLTESEQNQVGYMLEKLSETSFYHTSRID